MNLISRIHPGLLVVASVCSLLSALPASAGLLDDLQDRFDPEEPAAELQNAIFVGNNWDGTIDVINGDTPGRILEIRFMVVHSFFLIISHLRWHTPNA